MLFERVGRGFTLTPSGLELLDHVRAMGDAANRVSLTAAGQSQSIEGTVCIAASETHAAMLLPPIIAKLRLSRAGHPRRDRRLEPRSATCGGVRRISPSATSRPTEPDLIARKVRDIPARLYASPELSRRHRQSQAALRPAPRRFHQHRRSGVFLKGLNALGLNLTERNFPILTDELSRDVGTGEARPRHRHPGWPHRRRRAPGPTRPAGPRPLVFPIWLVAHRDLNTSRRVRVVFDLLARELATAYV